MGYEQSDQADEHSDYERMDEPVDGFVENDYKVDDEQPTTSEEPVNLDFNFCFGLYEEQKVRDTDNDYGNSVKLESWMVERMKKQHLGRGDELIHSTLGLKWRNQFSEKVKAQ